MKCRPFLRQRPEYNWECMYYALRDHNKRGIIFNHTKLDYMDEDKIGQWDVDVI